MCIREDHSLTSQLVRMRRRNLARARSQALDISISKIIANDVDDIGFILTEQSRSEYQCCDEEFV